MSEKKQSEVYKGKAVTNFLMSGSLIGMGVVCAAFFASGHAVSLEPLIGTVFALTTGIVMLGGGIRELMDYNRAASREEMQETPAEPKRVEPTLTAP